MIERTKWFSDCGWGVFCHWLGAPPSSGEGEELTPEAWNRQVDAFDVKALACQLESIGAPYLFITIGQNSGHYLAPNNAYDKYVNIFPSKCSNRDLIADLYEVLHPRGIELLVYLPSGAPAADPVAIARLEWEWGFEDKWPIYGQRTGKRLVEFQKRWEEIVREWSTRWGAKVRGWWIDGCYFADEMYRHDDEPNFHSFVAALKAGNSDALIAFNPGVRTPIICHTEYEDYTAGEISVALPECPGVWIERNGHKARYHILSYLGESWCQGERPRFPDELVANYTRYIANQGGVVTWDVPIERNGTLAITFMEQLKAINKNMQER